MFTFYIGGMALFALAVIFSIIGGALVTTSEAATTNAILLRLLKGDLKVAMRAMIQQNYRLFTNRPSGPWYLAALLCAAAGILCLGAGPIIHAASVKP